MSPLPLPERIRGALRLEPMSATGLARCLVVARETVYRQLRTMQTNGAVRRLSNTSAWINTPRESR